ncbi:MAG TPA: hypothetical protein VFV87_00715, partial [Pirellulaceae bacterium]|nr:hypothetical protein [Pirellulaceae bacterium]
MPRFLIACIAASACFVPASFAADAWKPASGPLMTRWAKDVSPEKVHPEYPRPQMVRQQWTNLNGLWDYAIVDRPADAEDYSEPQAWDGQILVPFPIESSLSGVRKQVGDGKRLWYRRTFKASKPADGGRLLLHFGAVDWHAVVFVNDAEIGEHRGGYDPFTFDITDALDAGKEEQVLLVAVHDPNDANWQPRGKQVNQPKGIWYTPTTGIWQTVWLEEVPVTYIKSIQITPDIDNEQFEVVVNLAGDDADPDKLAPRFAPFGFEVLDGDRQIQKTYANDAMSGKQVKIRMLSKPKLWSPESPSLYSLKVQIGLKQHPVSKA